MGSDVSEEQPPKSDGVLHGNISSRGMTYIGVALAMLQPVQLGLPEDTPAWIQLLIAALASGLAYLVGQSHPGTGTKRLR